MGSWKPAGFSVEIVPSSSGECREAAQQDNCNAFVQVSSLMLEADQDMLNPQISRSTVCDSEINTFFLHRNAWLYRKRKHSHCVMLMMALSPFITQAVCADPSSPGHSHQKQAQNLVRTYLMMAVAKPVCRSRMQILHVVTQIQRTVVLHNSGLLHGDSYREKGG